MKADDIKIGGEYVAGVDGLGRYGARAKCRVVGHGKAENRPRGLRRGSHRWWEVEWLRLVDELGMPRGMSAGDRTTIPSAWILREWTPEDETLASALIERERQATDRLDRLIGAFGLSKADRWMAEDEASVLLRGQLTPFPTYTLTAAAVDEILAAVEPGSALNGC